MQPIAQLRKRFGLSQANLAIYLSISVSLLKMVEAGKRELPFEASLKVIQLQQFAHEQVENIPVAPPDARQSTPAIKELRKQVARLEIQVQKNNRLLENMTIGYQQAVQCANLLDHLLQNRPAGKEGKKDKLWIEVMQADVADKQAMYAPEARLLIEWKIQGYLYTIDKANELLQRLQPNAKP